MMKQPLSKYTPREIEDFQRRIATALINNGLDTEEIMAHPENGAFLESYANDVIIKQKERNALLGILHKFAAIDVERRGKIRTFPIVNEYTGHDLTSVHIFCKGSAGQIEASIIKARETPIIIIP